MLSGNCFRLGLKMRRYENGSWTERSGDKDRIEG